MTTTSHEICRISFKKLPLYIPRDSKAAFISQGNYIYVITNNNYRGYSSMSTVGYVYITHRVTSVLMEE